MGGTRSRLGWAALLLCVSCAGRAASPAPVFARPARWVVLPFVSQCEAVDSGLAAQGIAAALLRLRGVDELVEYASASDDELILDGERRLGVALARAREQGFTYAVAGHVQEWRYRTNASADPAVGLTITILDVTTGRALWTGTAARGGWGNDTLAGLAHQLLSELLDPIGDRRE